MKYFVLLFLFPLSLCGHFFSESENFDPFFFDAICFKSTKNDSLSRIDIFILVPYSTLTFFKTENHFTTFYDITIILKDSLGNRILSETFSKSILENEQLETLGLSGKFQQSYYFYELPEGKITIEIQLYDRNSNSSFIKTRTTNTLNFEKYDFALSGIMLVSEIENVDGKYKITPHLSDDLSDLPRIFLFFETYQKNKFTQSTDFLYQILNFKGKELFRSQRFRKEIPHSTMQFSIQLQLPDNLEEGSYFVRLLALKQNRSDSIFFESDILAVTEKAFKIAPSLLSSVIQNLDKAIRQLKYVANQGEIDYINETKDQEERQRRFIEFWKKLDPTPSNEFNEAFEEYYSRIKYANENYKSYLEGWLTDRGMIYIVLGPPFNIQQQTDYYYSRTYEIWTYANNRQFIFVDYSGFGDFRLYSPPTFSEKYVYKP